MLSKPSLALTPGFPPAKTAAWLKVKVPRATSSPRWRVFSFPVWGSSSRAAWCGRHCFSWPQPRSGCSCSDGSSIFGRSSTPRSGSRGAEVASKADPTNPAWRVRKVPVAQAREITESAPRSPARRRPPSPTRFSRGRSFTASASSRRSGFFPGRDGHHDFDASRLDGNRLRVAAERGRIFRLFRPPGNVLSLQEIARRAGLDLPDSLGSPKGHRRPRAARQRAAPDPKGEIQPRMRAGSSRMRTKESGQNLFRGRFASPSGPCRPRAELDRNFQWCVLSPAAKVRRQ